MRTVNIIFTLLFRGELGAPVSVADSGILLPREGQLLREDHAEHGPGGVGGRSWPPGAAARASRHGGCPERAGLPPVGGQGLFGVSFTVCICTSCRVVGWPPALAEEGTFDRLVCMCDIRTDCASWSVTIYVWLSCRVCGARHESPLRAVARLHTDQADLSRKQPVGRSPEGTRRCCSA